MSTRGAQGVMASWVMASSPQSSLLGASSRSLSALPLHVDGLTPWWSPMALACGFRLGLA